MSQVSWYPRTAPEQKNFFLRTFPMFVVLLVFIYFGLDWMGAFEFLEILVRDNSAWLLKTIWGYDTFQVGFYQRVDADPLGTGIVYFGQPYFPGIVLDTYPRTLLIIRACTGMEAGALLMALIFVTPAKWENKLIAQITNFLMMHIGNTFRVAFHFWYTQHLYQKYIANGMALYEAADKAFEIAHDSLSKVFGFVGIVIFTLVIERTGVRIVSTFGAWIDGITTGFKQLTGRISTNASYLSRVITHEELAQADEVIPSRVENIDKINFYPNEEIASNRWSFFKKSFGLFAVISIGIISLGLIPQLNRSIGVASDNLAIGMGASLDSQSFLNTFWWSSKFDNLYDNDFIINIASSGILLYAIIMAAIIVTPGKWERKGIALSIASVSIIPLNILRLGFQKWATWSAVTNNALRINRPLLYLNVADMVTSWLPLFFWIGLFALLMYIFKKLDVKAFHIMWAWLNQLIITLGWLVGLRKRPGKEETDKKETKKALSSD
ncbi:MAG TPA: heimdallarchaeosortase [Candidatus Bathyarchaeia archaeon]|nr:heimdallarchaeosortase [Candidatus Bathyarchaeia archaeon]